MKEYGVLIATSHTTLGKNVGSCKENFKAKIRDTKELLQREGVKQHVVVPENQGGSIQLNREELERVRSFLNKLEKSISMCSLTYSTRLQFSIRFNVSNIPCTHYWVLECEATNHITPFPKYFSRYCPCPNNKKISIANGN